MTRILATRFAGRFMGFRNTSRQRFPRNARKDTAGRAMLFGSDVCDGLEPGRQRGLRPAETEGKHKIALVPVMRYKVVFANAQVSD